MMLLALVLTVMGATSAMGQKIYRAELDKSMFKAWTSNEPGATEDADPAPEPKSNNPFACETNLYKEVGAYGTIFGSSNVYYLWYADITGTQTMYVTGTPGMKIRVMLNRVPYVEGGTGDLDGGAYVELIQEVPAEGTVAFDLSSYEYLHLNAIKVPGGSSAGVVTAIEIEGTVKPVTGILSMINNGDAAGTDLESFPVSYDGPNNGDTANERPEIVGGGVDDSKCFKVTSYPEPTQNWHTQFYIKADEVMPKGTKWKLVMSVKADNPAYISTSAQATPRAWKGSFIDAFQVGTEWKEYSWEGEIAVDDFQSIAFDLNNGAVTESGFEMAGPNTFYFDNIQFGVDLGGANPIGDLTFNYGSDIVCVNLADKTNMKDLVSAAGGKTLIYPNDCVTVTWNGNTCNITSVEGRPNGNFYIFLEDTDGQGNDDFDDEEAVVKVGFKNPADAAYQLTFKEGKWAGEPVPDFSGVVCKYDDDLAASGEFFSYLWGNPELEAAEPEKGSFGLPADTKEFLITFNQAVNVESVVAQLGKEKLEASAVENSADKVVKLTRTSSTSLEGKVSLTITSVTSAKSGYGIDEPIVLDYSFGPVVDDPNDKQADIYVANFTSEGDDAYGEGWIVNADGGGMQPANSGSGCRLQHGKSGFAADVLYLAQRGTATGGVALYGTEEGHQLQLEAKTYHLKLAAAQWDSYNNARALLVQVLPLEAVSVEDGSILDESAILAQERKDILPEFNNSKDATLFDLTFTLREAGNCVIRMVPSKPDGSFNGYNDGCAIGNVKVEYIPDVMGLLEIAALNTSLENAKAARDGASDSRYDGETFNTIDAVIKKYDGQATVMTAPSAFAKGVEELDAATEAMNAHKKLCDEYDALPGQAFEIYFNNKDGKFNVTEYFAQIKSMVEKYCTVEKKDVEDEDGNVTNREVMVDQKVLKDDKELTAAKAELSEIITMATKMFTVGKSTNVWGNITSGYAALHERLRRGVELLKSLGLADDADEIAAANAELGDNDDIAEAIIKRASNIILADLASGATKLFATKVNEETLEEAVPSYDLSVYAKNPNIYGPAKSIETPGWTNVTGNGFAWSAWDGATNHSVNTPYPEDCLIHAGWHPSAGAISQQTIENLPAGIYTVKFKCSDNNSPVSEGTCAFVKTSSTPEVGEGETLDPDLNYAGYVTGDGDVESVEVVDGKLTVGFNFGPLSQAFLNDVEIWMTAPIAGFDYGKAYEEVMVGIDEAAKAAKVRALEVYDLNGRRLPAAGQKGIVIVKKYMSDGTVRTEKVLK